MTYRKVGGLHFVKVWRFQFSWCKLTKHKARQRQARVERVFSRSLVLNSGQRVLLPAR